MEAKKILVVEDDEALSLIVSDMLTDYGFFVKTAKTGCEAYDFLGKQPVHLVLLDINLPEESGFKICREIRKISTVPIIFASARTNENDRITSLDLGGDDYLPKPYSLKELLSHINALLRRTYGYGKELKVHKIGTLEVDLTARQVRKDGREISLSLKEFDVLAYLVENKGKTVKKEEVLTHVWGIYSEVEPSTVAVHVRWLREKLEDNPSKPALIKTVWGVGYLLSDEMV